VPKRKSPQSRILDYFDTAPLDEANSGRAVCVWLVAKRQPGAVAKPRAVRKPRSIDEPAATAAR
jgi:hypothetical protein